jgi:hypothetical protein
MDRLFACLFLASIAGNVANFYHNNAWIHDLNALPAVLLIMIATFRVDGLYDDKKMTFRNRFGTYLVVLFLMQFGLEYLRQLIAGVSKSENYEHLAILVAFILLFVFLCFRKPKNPSLNLASSDLPKEAQKNGDS